MNRERATMYPNIETKRKEKGFSKSEVIGELNISLKTYYNWINGENDIPCSKIIKLAKLLDCSIDELLR